MALPSFVWQIVFRAANHERKKMLVFLDCEFTDFIDCELISLAMVSDDGQHQIYLEVADVDRSKCNTFVQSAVWHQLGYSPEARVMRSDVEAKLRNW